MKTPCKDKRCTTCVPPVYHLCTTCVPPVYHLCTTCVPPVYHLCTTCVPPVYHLCTTCVPPVYHLCTTCVPPVYHLCTTCVPPVYHLCPCVHYSLVSHLIIIIGLNVLFTELKKAVETPIGKYEMSQLYIDLLRRNKCLPETFAQQISFGYQQHFHTKRMHFGW